MLRPWHCLTYCIRFKLRCRSKNTRRTLRYVQTEPQNDALRNARLEAKAKGLGDAICDVEAKERVVTLGETPLEKKPDSWAYTR